ncbi:MAG: DUF1697 domain-containing protein [Acidobacteria bacterium]|nr:DUF1697 domain-containing protein [Acidobacteriota bacterium]
MAKFVVLLRGVNVGGINIKMAELRRELTTLPCQQVTTLLASGNVLLTSEIPLAELKALIEAKLRESFGYDAWVILLPAARVDQLITATPFAADSATGHAYVTASSDPEALNELMALAGDLPGIVRIGPEAIAWQAPIGGTLDAPFGKLTAKAKFKSNITTRNLRTLIKLRDAADAL